MRTAHTLYKNCLLKIINPLIIYLIPISFQTFRTLFQSKTPKSMFCRMSVKMIKFKIVHILLQFAIFSWSCIWYLCVRNTFLWSLTSNWILLNVEIYLVIHNILTIENKVLWVWNVSKWWMSYCLHEATFKLLHILLHSRLP